MDKRTKEQLSAFLANELHKNHLNGAWFDEEDVLDVINDFLNKKPLLDKKEQLEKELKRINHKIEHGDDLCEVFSFYNTLDNESENKSKEDDKKDVVKNDCEYCSGKPMHGRKPLMENQDGSYTVFINSCNYLEDSVVGNSVPHSLIGVKIKFCPVCGRDLENN